VSDLLDLFAPSESGEMQSLSYQVCGDRLVLLPNDVCYPCPRVVESTRPGGSVARRRFQNGSVFSRGKRKKVWVGRWLEDEIRGDGSLHRRHVSEVLGTFQR
jgi:hypothetical protein